MEVKNGYKQTEIGVIPSDWLDLTFKDICWVNQGLQIPISQRNKYPNVNSKPYITIQYLNDGKQIEYIDDYVSSVCCEKDDILMTRTGNTGIVVSGVDGVFHNNFFKINIDRKKINKDFIIYYLNQPRTKKIILAKAGTSTIPDLNHRDFYSLKIPLPPTLKEQTAIATALSDTDAWINSLEQLLTKKRQIKQGAMQELLQPKEGWEVSTIKQVANFRRGSFPQPYGLDKWYDDYNGMPFVQVYDVDDNKKLKVDTKRKISIAGSKFSVFVEKGSVIITIQGSIGRIAITQYDAYVDRTLLIFESFNVKFDKYFFVTMIELLFEKEKEKAPGGIIKTITKEALSSFEITYPDFEEQTRIATILSDMDEEIGQLESKLEKAKQLKQGMMQELLTGRIRLV
ncbi:restriction endonuclease subunit S [Flavobacterium sp. N2270]|uniref:restriction endonuclease subunit S n=1 Tax=Flavobacterium sp. N2270 TaxID=2986831 RepID=UPI00222558A4|nr:restriction endonuclease subunit S [Flavobacterium sp. N2270]